MINHCPHCLQTINLSAGQQQKIESAFAGLQPGGALKIGCPHCGQTIQLKKENDPAPGGEMWEDATGQAGMPNPPAAPDTSWLSSGKFDEKEEVKDVPKALVLIPAGQVKNNVTDAFVQLFYQVIHASNAAEALDQMRYVDFEVVVLHSGFEGGGLTNSAFHKHMCLMPMTKRRTIYYVVVGPEMHSFYDLEALSFSANLAVNDNDTMHMKTIIRKGLRDNEELFGPFLQALKALGKK